MCDRLPAQDRIEPAVAERQVEPQYPADLRSYFIEPARVDVVVDQQGFPFSVKSVTSLPDNVVQALSNWRFRPARRNGDPVGYMVRILVPIHRPIEEMVGRASRSWNFSKEVNDVFAAAKDVDSSAAARLQENLAANPDNLSARLELLAYSRTATDPGIASIRLRQLLWFAANQPKHEILGAPFATPNPRTPADVELYEQLRRVWLKQLADDPRDPTLLAHATNFLRFSDPEAVERTLQQVIGETDRAAVFLGDLYGIVALGITSVNFVTGNPSAAGERLPDTPFAVKSRAVLGKTDDLRILFAALSTVSSAGPSLARTGHVPDGYTEFCEQLLARAKEQYPEVKNKCDAPPPPPGKPNRLRIGGAVQQARMLKQVVPKYPPEAKARGITGTVAFHALINKDGRIQELQLLQAPLALYQSARDAVLRWEYKPTLLNGEPVAVETQIDVNYTLNR